MYLGGQGVAQDRREAFVWLNLAAQYMSDQQALAKIKRIRDEIGKNLTKDDIAYAKAESMLLAPESSSVQPNEAESIDHLPEQLPAAQPPVTAEPLQNVPPDTAPLSDIPLQNALPAAPAKPLTVPGDTLPSATTTTTAPTPTTPAPVPAETGTPLPTTTATQPSEPPLPTTTAPTTPAPIVPPTATQAPPPSATDSDGGATAPSTDVEPVPQF
jgi:hypothetical protein